MGCISDWNLQEPGLDSFFLVFKCMPGPSSNAVLVVVFVITMSCQRSLTRFYQLAYGIIGFITRCFTSSKNLQTTLSEGFTVVLSEEMTAHLRMWPCALAFLIYTQCNPGLHFYQWKHLLLFFMNEIHECNWRFSNSKVVEKVSTGCH